MQASFEPPTDARAEETRAAGELSVFSQFSAAAAGRSPENEEQATAAREEFEENFRRESLRRSREAEVREFFGPVVMDTDWSHPDLRHNAENIARVRSWQYQAKGVLAAGKDTGTGKSRAIAALTLRIYAHEGREAALWNSQELFARITQSNDFGRDFAREFIDGLASRKLLVLEDLGQEATARSQSPVVQQWFFRLLDLRYGAGLPCLITTNHTVETLSEAVDKKMSADPLIRRLLAVADPVKFNPIPPTMKRRI